MKRIIYTILLIAGITNAFALPKKHAIPRSVHSYVNLHYPDAKRVHWMVHEGNYIVSLWASNIHVELCLNEKGEYENSLKEILFYEDLPSKIKANVDIRNLAYAQKLEGRHGELYYLLEVSLPKGKVEEMVFDKTGNRIKDFITDDQKEESQEDVLKF